MISLGNLGSFFDRLNPQTSSYLTGQQQLEFNYDLGQRFLLDSVLADNEDIKTEEREEIQSFFKKISPYFGQYQSRAISLHKGELINVLGEERYAEVVKHLYLGSYQQEHIRAPFKDFLNASLYQQVQEKDADMSSVMDSIMERFGRRWNELYQNREGISDNCSNCQLTSTIMIGMLAKTGLDKRKLDQEAYDIFVNQAHEEFGGDFDCRTFSIDEIQR